MIYSNHLTKYAKNLRQRQTPAEILLWSKLRGKRFLNIKFKRQQPIDKYIVDFYSIELNLIIEIDGMSHDEIKYNYDKDREYNLKNLGFNLLRFTEFEVKTRIDDVLQTIENFVNKV